MKKTLIITLEYPPTIGGIATYVHDLANALDPKKTIVLAPPHPDQDVWDSQQKYMVIRKHMFSPKFVWPRWIRLLRIVNKISKQEGIELIMIHHVLPAGYASVRMKRKGIPFLLFSHGTDLVAGTATRWKKRMVIRVSAAAEQIIFNSKSLKKRFLDVLPEFEKKSTVVYPCPEPDFFVPPPQEDIDHLKNMYALEGKQTILSVSRIVEGKGFPHLVRMMPEILKRAPHLVWLIIGDGSKKELLMQLIQKYSLQNVVRFIGEIPHADLKKYYYLADLFVLLTHPDEGREEGLGLVFLEAAATGLPVVAGRSGGVEEAVIDGETGLVMNLNNEIREIPDAIVALLNNKEKSLDLGRQAQERIQRDFQWPVQLEHLRPWLE
jgi:phosphatidylinositol alpha-1,6-mannosyltransferase